MRLQQTSADGAFAGSLWLSQLKRGTLDGRPNCQLSEQEAAINLSFVEVAGKSYAQTCQTRLPFPRQALTT